MEPNNILDMYKPLVEFIGQAFGDRCEVILHDTSNPKNSVVAIKNGHLSGRKIGDPMTDFAHSIMVSGDHKTKDFIVGYDGRLKNGKRFISSTYFIKDGDRLAGFMCINYDPELILEMNRQLQSLMNCFNLSTEPQSSSYTEVLDTSISDISANIIHNVISSMNVNPHRTTQQEKLEIIESLENQDVFSTKGTVAQVASELGISEPTVYRYLKKIRQQ